MRVITSILVSLIVSGAMIAAYHYSGWEKRQSDPNWLEYVGYSERGDSGEAIAAESAQGSEKQQSERSASTDSLSSSARYRMDSLSNAPADFRLAAESSTPAVVHIKSILTVSRRTYDPFYELFGLRPRQSEGRQVSSGSGVILSPDGYIVTNNHVIQDADELTVTLYDNRSFKATVIGTDPSTDLGVIKIEGSNFPHLKLADSDEVSVGEWVLAVGNPFNLASTVTAGIVSAIGRDLEIIEDQAAIESFIQTDAAVNPGNSGGALINLKGQLIGVNTAIASPTGTYAGYAFAVPANIVGKTVDDLKEFGTVQRAYLGIRSAIDLNGSIAQKRDIGITEGVLVESLVDFGGAKKAGIQVGDVIVEIEGVPVRNDAKMLELVSRNRPGDMIKVKVYRSGNYETINVQLTDNMGQTEVSAPARSDLLNQLGISLADLSNKVRRAYGIDYGVKVSRLYAGRIRKQTDMRRGFIILRLNGETVRSAQQAVELMEKAQGTIEVAGFYPRYQRIYTYQFKK
jgi:serine protease Do